MKYLGVTAAALIAVLMTGAAVLQHAQNRSQVIIYVGDNCPPCDRLKADLKKYYKTTEGRYIVGFERNAMFRLVKSNNGPWPRLVYPNRRDPVIGYSVSHETLVSWHPDVKRIRKR